MFDFTKIGEQIAEKIKPVLLEGKAQAELSMLVNTATQIYCSEVIRGNATTEWEANNKALNIINEARHLIESCK